MLSAALPLVSLFDIIPQNSYLRGADSEVTFDIFTDACAQAGAAKCYPASMIHGNVTGSDIRKLFTSTIDVSLFITMYVSCEEAEPGPTARSEITEGRIYRIPISAKWRIQGQVARASYSVGKLKHIWAILRRAFRDSPVPSTLADSRERTALPQLGRDPESRPCV